MDARGSGGARCPLPSPFLGRCFMAFCQLLNFTMPLCMQCSCGIVAIVAIIITLLAKPLQPVSHLLSATWPTALFPIHNACNIPSIPALTGPHHAISTAQWAGRMSSSTRVPKCGCGFEAFLRMCISRLCLCCSPSPHPACRPVPSGTRFGPFCSFALLYWPSQPSAELLVPQMRHRYAIRMGLQGI